MKKRVLIVVLGVIFSIISFIGCSSGKGKLDNSDQDITSSKEWSPPYYCKDEYRWAQVHNLPASKDVDCSAQCEAKTKCQWLWSGLPDDPEEYKHITGLCIRDCGILGSYDYTQFATCDEMKKKIDELTMEYVLTADLPECKKPEIQTGKGPGADNPCRLACATLLSRCSLFAEYIKNGFNNNSDLESCASFCWVKYGIDNKETAWLVDEAYKIDCADTICLIDLNCQWPPEKLGDYDSVDEPAKIDYEVTP